jgi:hypothetical protein
MVDWGDGQSSAGVLTPLGNGQFSVTASKPSPYADEGTDTITVTVTGPGDDPPPPLDVTATVANAPLLAAAAVPFSAALQTPFADQVIATFADSAPAEAASGYQVAIDWGDNSGMDTSTGKVEAAAGGGFQVVGSHSYQKPGNFQVTVTIRDNEGGQYPDNSPFTSIATVTGTASVEDVFNLGPLSPTEWHVNVAGYPGAIPIIGGSAPYSQLRVTGLPTGLTAAVSGQTITIQGTPTQAGTFDIAVALTDQSGTTASGNYTLTVDPDPVFGPLICTDPWDLPDPAFDGLIGPQDDSSPAAPAQAPAFAAAGTAVSPADNLAPIKAYVSKPYTGSSQISVGQATWQLGNSNLPAGWSVKQDTQNPNLLDFSGTPQGGHSPASPNPTPVNTLTFQITINVTISGNITRQFSKTYQLPVYSAEQDLYDNNKNNLQASLLTGSFTAIAPPTPLFNCYAYAANQTNPQTIGWVWSGDGDKGKPPAGANTVVLTPGYQDLIKFYKQYGWLPVAFGTTTPHVPATGLVVIYENSNKPTHAALVTTSGVYAKMGELGTYKFTDVKQMAGGDFGQPAVWLCQESALPTISIITFGGPYNGKPHPVLAGVAAPNGSAGRSLDGVDLVVKFYAGTNTSGTPLPGAPVNAGIYTAVATFPGSKNFVNNSMSASFTITRVTPIVKVSASSSNYTGRPGLASALVAGITGQFGTSLEGVTPTLTYYSGSSASGTPLSGPPINAGTYTVTATFAGSTNYTSASASTTFTIRQVTATVKVHASGGTFTGSSFPASATVAGINGQFGPSLEGVTPTLTYYSGSTASGTPLSGPPTNAGTYTVVASFVSTSYSYTSATTTFTITKATPKVIIIYSGNTSQGAGYWFTIYVVGVTGQYGANLEGVQPTVTYYAGKSASGTPLSGPPANPGTYTVLASFAGSFDYTSASTAFTFTIKG